MKDEPTTNAPRDGEIQPGFSAGTRPVNDANRLGLNYELEADGFAYRGPVIDLHTHVSTPEATRLYWQVARRYGVERVFTMAGFDRMRETLDALPQEDRHRFEFIAVPDYARREEPGTFTTQWLEDIERFRAAGSRIVKFWAAPRARELAETIGEDVMRLDSPIRLKAMRLAHDLGYRIFMVHVADPDTWFATTYADQQRYGTKRQQYEPLEALMARFTDVTWIAAHTAGSPEDLDFVQSLLDRYPNLCVDISACKWQIRELSRHPQRFKAFVRQNRGRVLFGSDIVASTEWQMNDADLFASRYWAFRTLLETDYQGPSPIVDPDLAMVDPTADPKATAWLQGCALDEVSLQWLYHDAATALFEPLGGFPNA